jgi:NhaP-type Na+/H+ or K+/H+ antiporter
MLVSVWYLVVGGLLVAMALTGTWLRRLPLSGSLVYLAVGFGAGLAGLARLDAVRDRVLLEHLTEVAVILSLFTCGLKLRMPLVWKHWHVPLRLAFVSMALTVAGIAGVAVVGLGLSLGAAVLLGAVLAPTDPVLASDVQVEKPGDDDRLRFGLTGEAGLNDGTAFPLVMLGLGLLGHHPLGDAGLRWLAVDLLWAVVGGVGVGFVLGSLVGRLVVHLRTRHKEAVGLDEFLALGLIALSYGVALLVHAYGFLAVFAAGLALRRIEARAADEQPVEAVKGLAAAGNQEEVATHPEKAPAYMTAAVLEFNAQLERMGEVALMVVLGVLLVSTDLPPAALWFVPLLFCVIRPAAVLAGLAGSRTRASQARLMGWFGIRGVGSLYYLFYAANHGLSPEATRTLTGLVLATVTASVVVHGVSVTPLMRRYTRRLEHGAPRPVGRRYQGAQT